MKPPSSSCCSPNMLLAFGSGNCVIVSDRCIVGLSLCVRNERGLMPKGGREAGKGMFES